MDQSARRRPVAVLLLAALLLGGLLGGCARVRTALAVQPDDTVSGEIVFATPKADDNPNGPPVTVPADLASDVDVTRYDQDGYIGSRLLFSGLTFAQVAELNQAGGPAGQRGQLDLRRVGGRVLLTGKVDLTTVTVDRADFQLKVSFPGTVVETNGDSDAGTVSWTFTPGVVDDVRAVVAYDDPNAPSTLAWTLGLGVVVAAACAGVVGYARRTRNPPVHPDGS